MLLQRKAELPQLAAKNFRVLVSKEQYDRTVAYIRQLQAKSTTWSVELYNCNAFVADIAHFMGLRVPSSSWIYPNVRGSL